MKRTSARPLSPTLSPLTQGAGARRVVVVIALSFAACTGLRGFDDATFACADDSTCISGFVCIANRCAPPGTEGAACEETSDCTSGLACDRAQCRRPGADGSACLEAIECGSGVCAKGVCCATACDGACATCETGTCGVLPAGARGQCADFACTGVDAWCGNSCTPQTSATTCIAGFRCEVAQCRACLGSLRDGFASLGSAWQTRGEGQATAGDGGLSLTVTGDGTYRSIVVQAATSLPLEGCSFSVDVADPGNVAGGFFTTVQTRGAADGSHLGFRLDGQGLRAICRYSNGAPCPGDGRVLRASAMAFSRLRVAVTGDTVDWRGSAPGQAEVSLLTETGVTLPGNVVLELMAGTENAVGSTAARITGVNLDGD